MTRITAGVSMLMQHIINALFLLAMSAVLVFPGNAQAGALQIESLELDKTTVGATCPAPLRAEIGLCEDAPVIKAKVRVVGGDIGKIQLTQTVSGGRIRQGTNGEFEWDLTGLQPGEYHLAVTASDSGGYRIPPKSVFVSVVECPCELPRSTCPTVDILGPAGLVSPGETVKVEARITDAGADLRLHWSVSDGVIVSGQGTPTIAVDTSGVEEGATIEVVLRLLMSDESSKCVNEITEAIVIAELPKPILLDEFSTVRTTCEDGNSRLDSFFSELRNNPSSRGLIVIYDSGDRPDAAWNREQLLSNFIKLRRFDRSRITFIRGTFRAEPKTQFWHIPLGAADPELLVADTTFVSKEPKPTTTPYLYATQYVDGLAECNVPMFDLVEYAKVLNTEPPSQGRIIIGESSRVRFTRTQGEIANELAANGVPRSRLTFVYKYVRPNRAAETIALWVVPPPVGRVR